MSLVLGIDVGFSTTKKTWAISSLNEKQGVVRCDHPTFTATREEVERHLAGMDASTILAVGVDAPITSLRIQARPDTGRRIDARFSRGTFHASRRGPQPSSIAVPHPGWDLYLTGMAFGDFLTGCGWTMHDFGQPWKPGQVFEVIPKLTLTLMTPLPWITQDRPRTGNLRQADNYLFERAFNRQDAERKQALASLFPGRTIDDSLEQEILRVANHPLAGERHELIGGLVAGLQTLQVATGDACVVGAPGGEEGYFLLPQTWHPDWAQVWRDTIRPGDTVVRHDLRAGATLP